MPYTSMLNAALGMGLSRDDLIEMPWGELVLMMQARADEVEAEDSREASWEEISAWI